MMKKSMKDTSKFDYSKLTIKSIENEIKRVNYKSKYVSLLRSMVYVLIVVVSLAALVATFIMPVFEIKGSAMSPLYGDGDIVVSIKKKSFKRGDIVAFSYGNKVLVKRVIGVAGDWVNIDEDGIVYINNYKLKEPYVKEFDYGENTDVEFPIQVKNEQWFVLSDERVSSIDSRNSQIEGIKSEDIIGKVLFRIWPFK